MTIGHNEDFVRMGMIIMISQSRHIAAEEDLNHYHGHQLMMEMKMLMKIIS